jgi:hypothetical protein
MSDITRSPIQHLIAQGLDIFQRRARKLVETHGNFITKPPAILLSPTTLYLQFQGRFQISLNLGYATHFTRPTTPLRVASGSPPQRWGFGGGAIGPKPPPR